MRIPLSTLPAAVIAHYKLEEIAHNGQVNCEISGGMYGLPEAGAIANIALVKILVTNDFVEATHTDGLFTHKTRPITFCLIVDDFGVKYVGKEHADWLVSILSDHYELTTDWKADTFLGMHLEWDYENGTCDTSMPGYLDKALQVFNHPKPKKPQDQPYPAEKPQYGAKVQYNKEDTSTPMTGEETT